ncbi:Hsp20/alpha crystallin family protein [Pseudolysinimonas sp.]|uniref:Hsp20/alpha crystallin family protein n=1 Tax=Pseudolysinimonas sp. TaxID=2680009 RepID=UPI003F7F779E
MSTGREVRRAAGFPTIDALVRSWNDTLWSPLARLQIPATDAWVEGDDFIVRVQLPQFEKKDIEVQTRDGEITITAQRHEKDDDKRAYVLHESHESISRTIALPPRAEIARATASFADGALTVTVPLAEQPTSRQLEIA